MSANLICIFTARKLSERKFTNTGISCGFVIVSLTFNLWAFLWAGSTQHNKKQNIGGHGRLVYFKTTFWDVKTCRFVHQCILFSWYFPPAQDIKMYILFTAVAPLAWCCSRRQLSSLDDVNQIICCIMRICVCVCVCECACVKTSTGVSWAGSRSGAISLGVQGEAGITGEQVKAVKPTAEQRDSWRIWAQ